MPESKAGEGDSQLKASEVLFVDWDQPGSEPITFREMFLRSNVLHIVAMSESRLTCCCTVVIC